MNVSGSAKSSDQLSGTAAPTNTPTAVVTCHVVHSASARAEEEPVRVRRRRRAGTARSPSRTPRPSAGTPAASASGAQGGRCTAPATRCRACAARSRAAPSARSPRRARRSRSAAPPTNWLAPPNTIADIACASPDGSPAFTAYAPYAIPNGATPSSSGSLRPHAREEFAPAPTAQAHPMSTCSRSPSAARPDSILDGARSPSGNRTDSNAPGCNGSPGRPFVSVSKEAGPSINNGDGSNAALVFCVC